VKKWLIIILLLVIMPDAYTANQYCEDVLSGKQIVCKWVRLAVERHIKDLGRQNMHDFPYYFDEKAAKRIIDFKQSLKHIKGEWANAARKESTFIKLEPWQQFKDWVLFGWKRMDGFRRFKIAYITVARKNGKTTDAAGTGNYCVWADDPREFGAEGYCVATIKDQAKIAWKDAFDQVLTNPALSKRIEPKVFKKTTNTMYMVKTSSKFTFLGKDSKTQDGLNPHFGNIDEYHAHKDDGMLEIISSGMGARQQPLIYITTTAGFDLGSPCRVEQEKAEKVLEGSIVDETYFALIYTLDEGDDWTNPKVWIKANPNLGVSVYPRSIEDAIKKAIDIPSKQNGVKTKNLNVWTQAQTRWITHERWIRNCGTFDVNELLGRICYGGIDLSSKLDLSAYALCFPPITTGEKYKLLLRYFLPEDDIIQRGLRDRIDYKGWAEKGLIRLTPGNVIDYDYIEDAIREDSRKYKIKEIAFDPWNATFIENHIQYMGINVCEIPQKFCANGMPTPTKEFEAAIYRSDLATNNDPILTWMISCTELKYDRQNNFMPMKPARDKAGKRIDGVVASIMSYYRSITTDHNYAQVEIFAS